MSWKLFIAFAFILQSCGTGETYPPVENGLDAGRQFIDAIYKGNFKRAAQLTVDNANNKNKLQLLETNYHNRPNADRNNLGQASINILNVQANDSTTTLHFLNNYNNKNGVIKIKMVQGNWLIDLENNNLEQ